ncbi:MAG: hypothetical protein HY860_06585 [Chlamydiales bacterium]|nr:hypothetical protein [Chlamydiales bacterium]
MKKYLAPIFIFLTHIAIALDLSHLNDYMFFNGKNHIELEGYGNWVAPTPLTQEGFEGTSLHYSESGASGYAGWYPNKDNTLSLQAGYSRMHINWPQNPIFHKKNFNDLVLSLAWISDSVPNWRWVMDVGAHIDTEFFNFAKHTFYTGFLWGRFAYKPYMGIHYGVLGQVGVKGYSVLPIIGIDTFLSNRIQLAAVFPLDTAIYYYFTRNWKMALKWRSFGGWYRSNHRVSNDEPVPGALVNLYSSGFDGGIYYDNYELNVCAFGGYDIGGWMFTQKPDKTDGKYFHFGGAPYVGAKLEFAF